MGVAEGVGVEDGVAVSVGAIGVAAVPPGTTVSAAVATAEGWGVASATKVLNDWTVRVGLCSASSLSRQAVNRQASRTTIGPHFGKL